MNYQDINAGTIDRWIEDGWEWGKPISHEQFIDATKGQWDVFLTPTRKVPHDWLGEIKGKKILGLASGGGQLEAGFTLVGLYEDTNGEGRLHEMNIPTYLAMKSVK